MLQFIYFVIIYSILIFIWSYVYSNTRKGDKKNIAFLLFLGVLLFWILLNFSNLYISNNKFGIVIKSFYFIALLNISLFFLNFVYRLIEKKYDLIFYLALIVNTVAVFSRYLFPIDYSETNFWRMGENYIEIATIMSSVLTLPIILAIFLIIKYYRSTQKLKLKVQLKYILLGIVFASLISVISEYTLPIFFNYEPEISVMYFSILILVIFLFFAIIKYQFLNVQLEYIYQELFLYSNEGIILIDKDSTILSINQAAKEIFKNNEIVETMKITKYIKDYDFNENYYQYEITTEIENKTCHLLISQSPVESGEKNIVKLLHINDITKKKIDITLEKEYLILQSKIDQLSGLYNKSYYIDYCAYKNQKINENIIAIFIDIDNFKSINDTFGHLVGDKVIKEVANTIKSSLRINEKAIRYGGDEFLVILEKTLIEDAYIVSERIQEKVHAIKIEELKNFKLSLSIGISEGNCDVNILTEKADKAMYYSKTNGKNQITIYHDDLF